MNHPLYESAETPLLQAKLLFSFGIIAVLTR